MQSVRFVVSAVTSLAIVAILVPDAATPSGSTAASSLEAREVRRIQVHFDSALAQLTSRSVSSLSADQVHRRQALIEILRDYRDRAQFPHNYDFPGQFVPYFLDQRTGVLCAVGHLLASTGRRDIVDRVSRANNNLRIAQLARDTALVSWLGSNGLTLAEAAFIQPSYEGGGGLIGKAAATTHYEMATYAAVGASGALSLWSALGNSDGHSQVGTGLGLVTGLGAVALAVGAGGSKASLNSYIAANAIAGGITLALATSAIVRHNREIRKQRADANGRGRITATLSPTMSVRNRASAVLALSVRF